MAQKKKKKKSSSRASVLKSKINSIRTKLQEMREYKNIIAADGGEPDVADKERESKLIVQLLRHEKELAALEGGAPKPPIKKKSKPRRN